MNKNHLIKSLLTVLALITFLAIISIYTCYILECIRYANVMFNFLLVVAILILLKKMKEE